MKTAFYRLITLIFIAALLLSSGNLQAKKGGGGGGHNDHNGSEDSDESYEAPSSRPDGNLAGGHKSISRQALQDMLRAEGINQMGPMMRATYFVRVEIQNTGGGLASHSEVVLDFSGTPRGAIGKAWADENSAHRAQIGNLSACTRGGSYPPEGYSCPTNFNGMGWVDLSKDVGANNKVIIINDPNAGFAAGTVIWFSFDSAQDNVTYDIIEKMSGQTFGFGTITAKKFTIGGDSGSTPPPVVTPPPLTPPPPVVTPPARPPQPPVIAPPPAPGTKWDGQLVSQEPEMIVRATMLDMMAADGILSAFRIATEQFWVRIEIQNTGGGLASHSEVLLAFETPIREAQGKAWADDNVANRAQIGQLSTCTAGGPYAPEGHTCPVNFNGKGMIGLPKLVGARQILIINDPNAANKAGTVLWLGFNNNPGRINYDIIEKKTGQSFGFGTITAKKYIMGLNIGH